MCSFSVTPECNNTLWENLVHGSEVKRIDPAALSTTAGFHHEHFVRVPQVQNNVSSDEIGRVSGKGKLN